jgi:hypothetical protein
MKTTGVALTEGETVERSKKEGWVDHLFVQSNGCAIIVFKNVDERKQGN